MNKLISILLTLCITGCATTNVAQNYSLNEGSPNGLLIGSIKYIGALSGYRVHYRSIESEVSGYFEAGKGAMLIPIPPKSDFPNIKGKLQVSELPPGEYEISRWSVSSGPAYLNQTTPFSIKFKIEPGKATYIGSFVFTVTNKIGLTVTGVNVNFEDRYGDDIKILKQKYPNLDDIPIYRGLKEGLVKKDIGGSSSASWDMVPVFLQ